MVLSHFFYTLQPKRTYNFENSTQHTIVLYTDIQGHTIILLVAEAKIGTWDYLCPAQKIKVLCDTDKLRRRYMWGLPTMLDPFILFDREKDQAHWVNCHISYTYLFGSTRLTHQSHGVKHASWSLSSHSEKCYRKSSDSHGWWLEIPSSVCTPIKVPMCAPMSMPKEDWICSCLIDLNREVTCAYARSFQRPLHECIK